MAFSIQTYAIAKKYTDETAAQFGGLKGASCKIASITKSNGRNVVTFEWKNDEGETRTSTMNVDDGTPIYTWTAGDSYKYGDLVIYASCFYRCITPNSDVTFDDTKWNEIGSPDGNYDIIQDASQLPERFTEADRKMYYSIEDGAFWLWDGTQWVLQDNGGQTYTAGKYINIDANNEISVDRVIPNEAFTYTIKQIDDYSLEIIKTVNDAVVFDEVYSCYDPVAQQQIDVNETFDDAINIHIYPAGERSYTLLIASDTHEAGFKQTTPWWQRNTFVETFSTVDHSGEKLIIKSEMDTAINAIKDGQSIDSFADVETALAGKQDELTAGNNIKIDNDTISVNRWFVPAGKVVYTIITSDENYGQNVHIQRHTLSGDFIDDRVYTVGTWQTATVDGLIYIEDRYTKFYIELLKNSDEQSAGYNYIVNPNTTPTSNSFTFMMEQEENANDLIIRSELDAKQDTLTFDNAPTKNSNNPVKSGGVYSALADKQDALLYGGVNPSTGADGDMYVKLTRDESTLIDMFGSPSAESTDDYEMSYTVDSSVMGDYYDYEAFGTGKGFGQNGRGSMTITYHFKNSKFKPANVSYCNNFSLSGGGYLESANFAIKASNDGTNWDTLYSTYTPCTRNTIVSADITANTYYSYFKFEMNSNGGYTGIRNIVMNGISESYSNIDNIYFKNDGTWLKDAFAKKSDLDAKQDTLIFDDAPTENSNNPVKSGGVYSALAGKQGTITAGLYIQKSGDTISVKRDVSEDVDEVLTLTHDTSGGTNKVNAVLTVGGETIDSDTFTTAGGTFHDMVQISFNTRAVRFMFKYLVASKTQSAGYENYIYNEYTDTFVETIGEESKLIIKSELDTALSGKQDTLTFDSVPTDGSTNPVESNGVYDALGTKQDATDNNLQTTDKTVVGAINEHEGDIGSLKSGLTNLDNEVNGDATEYPYADVITIEDAVPSNLADCSVKIEPVQDLHGYDKPWVGGAGKNKLPLILADIKTMNTMGTWSDNVYTRDGITYTVNVDANGNVISITFSGANTSNVATKFIFAKNCVLTETHILTGGIASSWNTDGYLVEAINSNEQKYSSTTLNGISLPAETYSIYVVIKNNQSISGTVTIYPMLRLATETDATFAPYTNICPISGHTQSVVSQGDGINQWNEEWESGTYNAETGEKEDNPIIIRSKGYISILPSTKYCTVAGYMQIFFYDESYNYLGNITNGGTEGSIQPHEITTNANAHYMTFRLASQYGTTYNNNISINYPSTITTYHPYSGKTYTIALGDTIYGGTVDFNTGKVRVTHGIKVYSSSEVTLYSDNYSNIRYAKVNKPSNGKDYNKYETHGVSSKFFMRDIASGNFDNRQNVGVICGNVDIYSYWIGLVKGITLEEAQSLIDGTQIAYELATPFTVQLTPQQIQLLKGTNTLTASTGQISVTVNGVSGAIGQVQEQVNEISANAGGAKLKILKYTGTGTTSYTLDFGDDTPATIMQIIPEPGESVITNNYEYLSGFAWGVPFTYGIWANKSNNFPSNHGGFNISKVTYSNNTCTITGPSASAAANYEGQKYAVYYLV